MNIEDLDWEWDCSEQCFRVELSHGDNTIQEFTLVRNFCGRAEVRWSTMSESMTYGSPALENLYRKLEKERDLGKLLDESNSVTQLGPDGIRDIIRECITLFNNY